MKRVLLCGIAFVQIFALSAQVVYKGKKQYETVSYKSLSRGDIQADSKKAIVDNREISRDKSNPETILGTTTYDLQTNNSVHDRIARNSDGYMSVVWTASESSNQDFSDRGAGYSYYTPIDENWYRSGSYPREESDRCGWPTILYDGDGGEILISHSTASEVIKVNRRSTIGTGSWTESNISTTHLTWNRAAIGGPDSNTIHMIAATNEADSALFQGIANAIVYYRSTNKGVTWDKTDVILPGLGSANLGKGDVTTVDAYSIYAKGNHVAIGVFNAFNDVILLESTDNGDNWTATSVANFPYKGYDDFDLNADTTTIVTCDGSGSVIIDNNDVIHMSWGRMSITNATPGDGFFNRFYFTDSLVHYRHSNPSMTTFSGHYVDANNNAVVDISMFADYGFQGVVSFPNLAVGTDGSIYTLYTATADTAVSSIDGSTNMRHLYLIKSTDDGDSWGTPEDLTTTDIDLSENTYGDIYPIVDADGIRVVYQRDPYPSVYVPTISATGTPGTQETWQLVVSNNDIVYLGIDTNTNIGIEKVLSPAGETSVYPNPSNGIVDMTIRVFKDVQVDLFVTNVEGKVVYTYNGQPLKQGRNQIQLDLSSQEPGLYIVNLRAGESLLTDKIMIK